jgi:hypothetical protein
MALLCGRAGRLTAHNGGFRPRRAVKKAGYHPGFKDMDPEDVELEAAMAAAVATQGW